MIDENAEERDPLRNRAFEATVIPNIQRRLRRITGGDGNRDDVVVDFSELLLGTLGFKSDEFVSICHKVGDAFPTEVCSPSNAPARVASLPENTDIYFGVNPTKGPARSRAGRGGDKDVTRLAAFVADLDVKDGSCSNLEAARAIVEELSDILGTRPSAVTQSGGGLHPYWPVSDGKTDVLVLKAILKRWGRLVKAVAEGQGAKVDSVFDPARVLRVPGTYNCKAITSGRSVTPVICYADTGRRLTLNEVSERLDAAGVYEAPEDGQDITERSAPETWEFSEGTCAYVTSMIEGWGDSDTFELGKGRHQWLLSQSTRLHCAERLGCITEADYVRAREVLERQFEHLCATRAPIRQVPSVEFPAAIQFGIETAATKTEKHARTELGDHQHAKSKERSQASRLVDIALEDYRLGISTDGKPFGYSPLSPHIALDLRGGKLGLRQQLARDYFKRYDSVATQAAIAAACGVLEGMAREIVATPLHLRVAGNQDAVYIDIADENHRVVKIGGGTWQIVTESPHMFRRTELTKPMPDPARNGDLPKLWSYMNIRDEDKPLLLAILVDALINPGSAKPVTAFTGEHGTAKSASATRFVSLIDPSDVPLHSPPKDLEHWLSSAAGSWVVGLDNLSNIQDWLSDAFCRASSGSGSVKRQLYTDDGLAVVRFRRCVVFNGIDFGGLRGDLADRLISFDLQRISEDKRKTDVDLEGAWPEDWPAILGGVLDIAAEVHEMLPTLPTQPLPRMADFARVLICVDKIQSTDGMQQYRERLSRAMAESALSDSFIEHLISVSYDTTDAGKTASEMLLDVNRVRAAAVMPQDWPRTPKSVTARLKRNSPALRSMGWRLSSDGGNNKSGTTRWIIRPPRGGEAGETIPASTSTTMGLKRKGAERERNSGFEK